MRTQRARLKSADALKLIKVDHIRIGWINTRVKSRIRATKCFKNLGYGHIRKNCIEVDRTGVCMLCTETGHKAAEYKVPPNCAACLDMNEPTGHFPGSNKYRAHKLGLAGKKSTIAEVQVNDHEGYSPMPLS